ncbi:unnamed protein product (macronuclear) [Paramecium tetraurelia]|uniref:Uncharacterized protein n=1 Tax=Paramecium tetraurelia TaxID=5888 RepID=A0CGC3_PARTE|nr:uncharacterized protein GSPATT00007280001 [Paramecium tetraurelia]CAK69840.1 unnamed protein product [Paramecium tetraurelia]|eukprot:XP_001437237.1 hypothetical protein (macronuclear) [Paramecium tetraurelia strain d4-2]
MEMPYIKNFCEYIVQPVSNQVNLAFKEKRCQKEAIEQGSGIAPFCFGIFGDRSCLVGEDSSTQNLYDKLKKAIFRITIGICLSLPLQMVIQEKPTSILFPLRWQS